MDSHHIPPLQQALDQLGFNDDGAQCTVKETFITVADIHTPSGIHLQSILAASVATLEDQLQGILEMMDGFPARADALKNTMDHKTLADTKAFCRRQATRIREEGPMVLASMRGMEPYNW